METKFKKDFIINTLYAVIILFLALFVSVVLFKYLLPFVIGSIIAFSVQKPSDFLSRKTTLTKGACAAILSVLLYALTLSGLIFLLYRFVKFSAGFADLLPGFINKISVFFDELEVKYEYLFSTFSEKFPFDFNGLFENTLTALFKKIGSVISGFAGGVASGLPSFFVSSIVTLVATCYIAKDYDGLVKFLKNFLGKKVSERTVKIKNIFVTSVLKMIKGYAILLGITFLELYIGFVVIGVEYRFILAVLIALVDLLPVIGTGTVLVPWAVISALTDNIKLAVCLAVLYVAVLVLRNFLEPKIIGKQIGVNSLFTLATMYLGLKTFGLLGLILFPIIFIVTIKYYKSEMVEGLSV